MATKASFPTLAKSGIEFPTSPLAKSVLAYSQAHTSPSTVNHCLRSAYFALILAKKMPDMISANPNIETVVLSILMHDLGWATTKSLLSHDRRFEVDGADIARAFLAEYTAQNQSAASSSSSTNRWNKHRLQLVWDAIALHTTRSIALYKEPEVQLTQSGIFSDFLGPNLPGGLITVEEYQEVVTAFPRLGFKGELVETLCGLCRDKPATTYDNFVGHFGEKFGLDGKGVGREEFAEKMEQNKLSHALLASLEAIEQYE